jgi:uncharacterized protein (TIGR04255 family)
MNLPKKITPDRIRESIVQIFFQTEIQFDPLIGYLYGILGDLGFTYTNEPTRLSKNNIIPTQTNELTVNLLPQYLFFNENVKIQLHQNGSIIFNCINNYIGWGTFFSFIKDVLTRLSDQKVFQGYSRVGIRFISEFPNIDLLDTLKFSFSLEGLQNPYKNGTFRVEWADYPHIIIVNLGLKLLIPNYMILDDVKVDFVSLIDIDVIHQNLNVQSAPELFALIESAHKKQKEVFFGLLKDEFLLTLKPEY